jgi:hypothetical protein
VCELRDERPRSTAERRDGGHGVTEGVDGAGHVEPFATRTIVARLHPYHVALTKARGDEGAVAGRITGQRDNHCAGVMTR